MKYFYPISIICITLLISSCQKEDAVSELIVDEVESAYEYLETYARTPIVFQYTEIVEGADMVSGWFLTNKAEIK